MNSNEQLGTKIIHLDLDKINLESLKKLFEEIHIPRCYHIWLYDENGNNPYSERVQINGK